MALVNYLIEGEAAHYFGAFLVLPLALFDTLNTNTNPDRALSDSFLWALFVVGQYVWYLFLSYAALVTYQSTMARRSNTTVDSDARKSGARGSP